jgi:aminopeptidase YwaD
MTVQPRFIGFIALLVAVGAAPARAQSSPPLIQEDAARALAGELSGETAKRNLEYIARHHRMRGSRPFREAADFIVAQLRSYGLEDARVDEFAADGSQWYGTQRARPAWDAAFAELWEVTRTGGAVSPAPNALARVRRIASFDARPMTLAQDSESADVTAELVDVGAGTSDSDYTGKDVRGKIVLAAAQPGPVSALAVARHGAAGIVSYAQNQRTAWWGDDDTLVRWGHLETFAPEKTFGFMISLREARHLQQRLRAGEPILLHASVKAGQRPGAYAIATATIPGADAVKGREEIVFSCHLDHPRPGANDNASGCVTILEVARTYARLIAEQRLSRPARTLRFVWPPEIEGTITYLNARPDVAGRLKAAIHLDMVGGGPETKSVFHVTRGPASLPSFVNDVAAAIGAFVNDETMRFAATGTADYPLIAPEGGKEPLRAELVEFTPGSDHQVYTDGSFRIPAVYLNDWPDRYIHTDKDSAATIDATKLLRAGFIAAATGWVLANLDAADAPGVFNVVRAQSIERTAVAVRRLGRFDDEGVVARFHVWHERSVVDSMARFFDPAAVTDKAGELLARIESLVGRGGGTTSPAGDAALVFARRPDPKGPMSAFGYDYFTDKYGAERAARLKINAARPQWGAGGYDYEVLNLVDGRRTVRDITEMASAIYGPIGEDAVLEYLRALEEIGIVEIAS